jgi:hypothetical protein
MARFPHLFLEGPTATSDFSSPRRGGSSPRLRAQDRQPHAAEILRKLTAAWQSAEDRQAVAHADRSGIYLEFRSEPGFDLVVKSLESLRSGIRLLNVKVDGPEGAETTKATVFVPRSKSAHFLQKVQAYAEKNSVHKDRETGAEIIGPPKNATLVNSIGDVRAAILESFWQDATERLPNETPDWVEAWLSSEDLGTIETFLSVCGGLQIEAGEGRLTFPERTVCLIKASRPQLLALIERSDAIAEFRAAREVASFFIEMENRDQVQWAEDIVRRSETQGTNEIVVLVLDHGVNNGHSLLQPLLPNEDRHAVHPEWGLSDQHGHGTLMAGTAGYGDIQELLQTTGPINLTHGLESAKILPPPPETNPKRLWGHYTAQGVSRAEIQAPNRKRVICMAITSDDVTSRGRPSSWSGQIDELASGYSDGVRRLIILSAGNVDDPDDWKNYPTSNKTKEVHDPAQSWNALCVGAFTQKTRIADPGLQNYQAIAAAGDLSPFSTTSLTWPSRQWPIKPEVLFEGGNVAKGPGNAVFDSDDLKLLSTYYQPQIAQFAAFDATSVASAQAAWMAAKLQAAYPQSWPETIRALIVHSANWTPGQRAAFLRDESKASYSTLARICGYGVPNLERAFYCAGNSLTLISQAAIQPFDKHASESRYISKDMHLYRLPWPASVLRDLGEIEVTMRVTLSYFVEPSPGEVGWEDRYRYPSHALRFEANGPGEAQAEFIQRVNRKAREEDEHPGTDGPGGRWTIGEARNMGSIHSDIWRGPAVELASSNLIAVYPGVGWWRERHHLGRWNKQSRYSLLISVFVPTQEVDIYTPVAVQIGIPVPVPITIPLV